MCLTLEIKTAGIHSATLRADGMLWLLHVQVNLFLPLLFSKTVGGCLLCAACWGQSQILLWMPLLCLESMDWQWGKGMWQYARAWVGVHAQFSVIVAYETVPQLESLFPAGRKGICHVYTHFQANTCPSSSNIPWKVFIHQIASSNFNWAK